MAAILRYFLLFQFLLPSNRKAGKPIGLVGIIINH